MRASATTSLLALLVLVACGDSNPRSAQGADITQGDATDSSSASDTPAEPDVAPDTVPASDTNWNNRCAWAWPGWEALELVPPGEHTMVYSFESYPVGDTLQLAATANGNLDCDAYQSTFTRFVSADPSTCTAELLGGMYTLWEGE